MQIKDNDEIMGWLVDADDYSLPKICDDPNLPMESSPDPKGWPAMSKSHSPVGFRHNSRKVAE